MCGIVGIFCEDRSRRIPREVIEGMTDTMVHRGPDGKGLQLGAGVALGHRRLSIIDLEGGRQPITNESGEISVIANGEIYNYRALTEELEALGHTFSTRSDSEVLVHAYESWGPESVQRLNGMFAYAVLDEHRDQLVLVRDRLGIKPLYWARHDGCLIFASELKAILAYPGFPRRLDPHAVESYLEFRYVVGDRTFFQDIRQLPPAHRLVVRREGQRLEPYWRIPSEPELEDPGAEEAIGRTRELLASSVQYRMISDVPFGAYLSGGVDSSAIVALMAGQSPQPIKTYSIGFEEEGHSEFEYAALVAERYGTDHHEIVLGGERYLDLLEELIAFKDGPLSVPNEVPLWQMSRRLKEDITVVLSGEGADELFAGYGRIFRSADDFERLAAGHPGPGLDALRAAYGPRSFARPVDFFLHRYSYFGKEALQSLTTGGYREEVTRMAYGRSIFEAAFEGVADLEVARQFLWIFQRHHLPGLLQRLDTTTMATAVEGRVPFVDHRLVELGHRLPLRHKLKWRSAADREAALTLSADEVSERHDVPKWVLRRAVDDLLPAPILERRKVGFPVPLGKWLGGPLRDRALEVLLDRTTRERGIVDAGAVARALEANDEGGSWRSGMRIWMLLNLELFCRRYFDG